MSNSVLNEEVYCLLHFVLRVEMCVQQAARLTDVFFATLRNPLNLILRNLVQIRGDNGQPIKCL
jgi:hypothetical protein